MSGRPLGKRCGFRTAGRRVNIVPIRFESMHAPEPRAGAAVGPRLRVVRQKAIRRPCKDRDGSLRRGRRRMLARASAFEGYLARASIPWPGAARTDKPGRRARRSLQFTVPQRNAVGILVRPSAGKAPPSRSECFRAVSTETRKPGLPPIRTIAHIWRRRLRNRVGVSP